MKDKPSKPVGRPRSDAPALPIYDSMSACSAATGIPLAVLKKAKKSGCEGFRSNRVDLALFLKWLFAQGDDADIDWGQEYMKAKAKREKHKLAEDEKRVIDRSLVTSAIQSAVSAFFTEGQRIFEYELPADAKGKDEAGIKALATKALEEMKTAMRSKLEILSNNEQRKVDI